MRRSLDDWHEQQFDFTIDKIVTAVTVLEVLFYMTVTVK